jgi:hypothetical protein
MRTVSHGKQRALLAHCRGAGSPSATPMLPYWRQDGRSRPCTCGICAHIQGQTWSRAETVPDFTSARQRSVASSPASTFSPPSSDSHPQVHLGRSTTAPSDNTRHSLRGNLGAMTRPHGARARDASTGFSLNPAPAPSLHTAQQRTRGQGSIRAASMACRLRSPFTFTLSFHRYLDSSCASA